MMQASTHPGRRAVQNGLRRALLGAALSAALTLAAAQTVAAQPSPQGTTYRSPGGTTLKLILGDSTVGPMVSMGELTFPPNQDSGEHSHGSIEILYVLSGELEHTANGVTTLLKPGMTGYVKPPDKIRHKTGAVGAKVLVIWVPGEEANRIISRWKKEP